MLGTAGTAYCGDCTDRFWKLDSVSSEGADFNGLGGLLAEFGRAGLTGSATTLGAGACGAETKAAELGAGACFALLVGEAGPAAALEFGVVAPAGVPTGVLPLKQLSQTFCWFVL